MKTVVDDINVHPDRRGYVFEPIEKDFLTVQRNVHVVVSEPGAIRGNHYHPNGTETIAVKGEALVRLKENNNLYDIKVPGRKVYRFVIPPKVSHAIKNIGDQVNILVAFNTVEHDPQRPDQVHDILIRD